MATPSSSRRAAALVPRRATSTVSVTAPRAKKKEAEEDDEESSKGPALEGNFELSQEQVSDLVEMVCESKIAALDIELGGMSVSFRRSAGSAPVAAAAPPAAAPAAPAPAPAPLPIEAELNGSSGSSLFDDDGTFEDNLDMVTTTKVGVLRRGRRGEVLVSEGDQVKKGQTVAFVEQLGTLHAVESTVAGEVVEVYGEDGEPVEFGQPIFGLVPSFVGIKKGAGSGTGQMA